MQRHALYRIDRAVRAGKSYLYQGVEKLSYLGLFSSERKIFM